MSVADFEHVGDFEMCKETIHDNPNGTTSAKASHCMSGTFSQNATVRNGLIRALPTFEHGSGPFATKSVILTLSSWLGHPSQ